MEGHPQPREVCEYTFRALRIGIGGHVDDRACLGVTRASARYFSPGMEEKVTFSLAAKDVRFYSIVSAVS